MPGTEARAFAPGRVNLIGEHTDYNCGLALPLAIAQGVTVHARATDRAAIQVQALDLGERDELMLVDLPRLAPSQPNDLAAREYDQGGGWRLFVRGMVAALRDAGCSLPGADLEISGDLPRGAGLSSSAALEVALGLALLALGGAHLDRRELARLCSRVERDWRGAHTGLLDQLASLYGRADRALRIDFASLDIQPVPLVLSDGWRLAMLDSGDARALAESGYNERRAECARACELLGISSLREAPRSSAGALPRVLARRVEHVLEENARVLAAVAALHNGELHRVGALLDASHASLRDLYECSTPAVEATVKRLKQAGAIGARMVGGGFGGHALGLFPPDASPPTDAREVRPSAGAQLVE